MLRIVRSGVSAVSTPGSDVPNGVAAMQSGQIGLPQLQQETPVSRPGWR